MLVPGLVISVGLGSRREAEHVAVGASYGSGPPAVTPPTRSVVTSPPAGPRPRGPLAPKAVVLIAPHGRGGEIVWPADMPTV